MPYYAGMTTLGSLVGCFMLYGVARRGGESFLRKRLQGPLRRSRADAVSEVRPAGGGRAGAAAAAGAVQGVRAAGRRGRGVAAGASASAIVIGRGIRYFGQGYLAVLYGERAADFMKAYGAQIGIGLAVAAVVGGGHRHLVAPATEGADSADRSDGRPAVQRRARRSRRRPPTPTALAKLEAYRALLSADEHERMARFVFDRDRRAFLLTRALVRTMLSRYAAVAPARLAVHRQRARTARDSRSAGRRAGPALQHLAHRRPDRLRGDDRPRGRRRRRAHRPPPRLTTSRAASSRRLKSPTCARCRTTSSSASSSITGR